MRRRRADRRCEFRMVRGVLNRTAELPDGRSYRHICTLEAFTEVVHFIEEHAKDGVTTTLLWETLEGVPCTQATVAIEFLKDRGMVEIVRRRCFPASGCFFEEAMCEWHALCHQAKNGD